MPNDTEIPGKKFKVTMLLADHAQAVQGKLYITGGGWSITGPNPTPSALAIKVEVPWGEANRKHEWKLSLIDGHGQPVRVPTPVGDANIEFAGNFECGRPAGLPQETPLDMTLAFNLGPIPLQPGSRYAWKLKINDLETTDWEVWFSTRPMPQVLPPQ